MRSDGSIEGNGSGPGSAPSPPNQGSSAAPETELVAICCLCGGSEASPVFATRDKSNGLDGQFFLVRCVGCGLVRLSPRPTPSALARFYPDKDYYAYRSTVSSSSGSAPGPPPGAPTTRGGLVGRVRAVASASLDYPVAGVPPLVVAAARLAPDGVVQRALHGSRGFPPYVAGGRALDIGCGNGAFLGLLARYGWSVTGVDVSEAASRSAAERGIEVFAGELEDAGLEARSFDYIRMSHSIEHVGDPVRTIGTISDLLRPGGLAYLETPNVASPMARWCGQDWFPLESPRHLWLFDPTTMRRALESNGLEVTKVSTRRFGSRPLSAMTWESTYRREEADGVLLPVRPVLQRSDLPRAVALTAAARLRRLARPDSDEIMSFWARRSPVPT